MSVPTIKRRMEGRRSIRSNPRTLRSPATALFELARQTHEKEALLKLGKALQNRLDSLGARLTVLDARADELQAFTGFRPLKRGRTSSKPGLSRAMGSRAGSGRAASHADRFQPTGVKVLRWKL